MPDELHITRRNLPHWELGGSTYFVDYRCLSGCTLTERARDIVLVNWRHWDGKRYLLHTLVVMPDHVHALLTPLRADGEAWHSLEEILHTNKRFTAREINKAADRIGPLWQDERYDRIIRNESDFWEKWNYIAMNPVKAGIVKESLDYRWLYQNPGTLETSTG